ncbi:PREDICTED: neurofilament heavy polypeptide-like [Dinoponera quadriceps]|uniref:Neurofilament heavy polypeptide-like n=1 Tax=Dinoponera quadriceps TaxID=609295 RepID=A0A6P3XVU8_DINQU|nr:PREDICTED: neurofilament heavy polypeptide-like [Dinoponera quadriceps]
MDYREKMVVVPQSKIKIEDDDDEDLETLRMVALQSIRAKDAARNRRPILPQVTQSSRIPYKYQRPMRRNFHYNNRIQQRQNGNVYYQSPRNPNLIAIVPVDEPTPLQQIETVYPVKVEKTEPHVESCPQEISKFHRFKDNGSASEDEDMKEQKSAATSVKADIIAKEEPKEPLVEMEIPEEVTENLQKNGEDQKEDGNDDDDDILLMADLEEEDSLERLMDEMEREMNVGKPLEKKEKKSSKSEGKNLTRHEEGNKASDQRAKPDESCSGKKDRGNVATASSLTAVKSERRSVSPHVVSRISQKRRSLSPRSRPRKKSPRRSPLRRSPPRQSRRSPRESTRYRSPRRSPSRYSPRPRSPKLSPRRSPNRTSSTKRSPPRKLSPRGRSPKLSSRSRSPRRSSRSKSPRPRTPKVRSRSRSPRLSRSRTPRFSPLRLSPRSKSPRSPPRRTSPRRLASRSPGLSPLRRGSSRLQSPKVSSPRRTPRRSPWSSPRNSPRLPSPRRRRSPKWSPKELPRKHGPRSVTPDNAAGSYAREPSPTLKSATTPEVPRVKSKQKDEPYERPATTVETTKEPVDAINDPVLEARRKKFESTRPIDPVNANKKIKLCKKHTASTEMETSTKAIEFHLTGLRKAKPSDEYDVQDMDLGLETNYEFEELEEADDASPNAIASSLNTCIDVEPQKAEKEKPSKKRKKRDKELYQVGKLKNELPLSERIGKDKKCKKRKEIVSDGPSEDVDAIFEDLAIDEEGDLRAELSRRRAERLNRTVPIQSARLVQSAFKGVVNEVVKNNAKANQRHVINTDNTEKTNQKEVRRVTVLHRSVTELHDSEDESTLDSKVPVRFRLGLNKQESRESKVTRKASKRQGRKVKHKNHLSLKDPEHIL